MPLARMKREVAPWPLSGEQRRPAFREVQRKEPGPPICDREPTNETALCFADDSLARRIFRAHGIRRPRKAPLGSWVFCPWPTSSFYRLPSRSAAQQFLPSSDKVQVLGKHVHVSALWSANRDAGPNA